MKNRHGRDRMVVVFTTYIINSYQHLKLWVRIPLMTGICSIQNYVIKCVS